MITLCTVIPEDYQGYGEVFFESLFRYAKHVSDVMISVPRLNGEGAEPDERWSKNGINFTRFSTRTPAGEYGHSLGLHDGIDRTQTRYIFFCDPDVVWLSSVDELYLNLLEGQELQYVGCSHHSAVANAYSYFPYVVNSLVRKADLPGDDFLRGQLKFRHGCIMIGNVGEGFEDSPNWTEAADGKYLISGPIPGVWDKLPNVKDNVFYDTAVNLCHWGILRQWRWLAFQTPDAHNYTTKYFRGVGISLKKMAFQKLIYHDVMGSPGRLRQEYEKQSKEDDES